MQYYTYSIGHRQAEKRIKSILDVKQHKRVNDNSLNELLNTFKRIELLPRVNDSRLNITSACDYQNGC